MKKENIQMRDMNLLTLQRVLFRAFAVNTCLVFIIWLLTFVQQFIFIGVIITGVSAPMFYMSALGALAIWGVAGVVLFFVPAIAIWWERKIMQ